MKYLPLILLLTSYAHAAIVPNLSEIVTGEPSSTISKKTLVTGQAAQENRKRYSRVSNKSSHLRFAKIKADLDVATDLIDFWGRQMSEHALFLHLGMERKDLKDEALEIHKAFEAFREKFNKNPKNRELHNEILPMLERERAFKVKILTTLDSGEWVGWIFPLFVNHIILELDYFVDKLNGITYTPEQELLFWNRINSEHAAFAAHLLDPQERALFIKADKLSQQFKKIPKTEKEMMLRLSLSASKELDEYSKTTRKQLKNIKSIIHPVLIEHVIREGERSIKTLEKLGLGKESKRFDELYKKQLSDLRK